MKQTSIRFGGRHAVATLAGVGLGLALVWSPASAQNSIVIVGATLGGELRWAAPSFVESCSVEWAPTATGPWTNSWAALVDIATPAGMGVAQVPVFYRVVGQHGPGLLLHGDGEEGSKVIEDSLGHAVSVRGDCQISAANASLGSGSLAFDGTGDYVDLGLSADWAFGTGDFTVDLWVNFTVNSGTIHLVGTHTSGVFTDWSFVYQGTVLNFYVNGLVAVGYVWTPTVGQWYHVAATRVGGVLRVFVDGRMVKSVALPTSIANSRSLTVGAANNPALFFRGYMDEVHVLKGRGMWTEDFTPPTDPYPL